MRDDAERADAGGLAAPVGRGRRHARPPRPSRLIAEIERLDRGRYAGPVGWIGASRRRRVGHRPALGPGRGATAARARLFAGCGIVADSVPADELAESDAKLIPVRDALR